MSRANELRQQILGLVEQYHAEQFRAQPLQPGQTSVAVAGRCFGATELHNLVDAALDFWLTTGRYAEQFERDLAKAMGLRHAILCNSGSSANLLAVSALTSELLGDRRLVPGDEVITAAAGFPTTVNPSIQNGLVPVFVDVELETYNVNLAQVEAAVSPRTRAIMLAYTLGNPFNLDAIQRIARQHNLWLIEDNCDALGSTYGGRMTGTFGDLATLSFYPAHHITMGEGGCVLANDGQLKMIVESFRDWGRACWCAPGEDNTCNRRFGWQLGGLPCGYDHKYTYSHIGYNLKATDLQAAVGVAQLSRLETFTQQRRLNWQSLYSRLEHWQEYLWLPRATANSEPSWFGFPITVKPSAPFTRLDLVRHLESSRVATRQLFGGNLTRQPAYRNTQFRVAGTLQNTDLVMHNAFWIGVYPGLTEEMLHYAADCVEAFLHRAVPSATRRAS